MQTYITWLFFNQFVFIFIIDSIASFWYLISVNWKYVYLFLLLKN